VRIQSVNRVVALTLTVQTRQAYLAAINIEIQSLCIRHAKRSAISQCAETTFASVDAFF
jgi:hypothetical protein